MGNVTEIPAGYSMQTLLYVNDTGINNAVLRWGEMLRGANGNKKSSHLSGDISRAYLGVTTDNGAYYYYNTVPGLTYQETLIAIKKYADSVGLPYRYWLLDSWYHGTMSSNDKQYLIEL